MSNQIALAQGNTADISFSNVTGQYTLTLPNSYSTSFGDTIVIAISYTGNGSLGVSGAQAIWKTYTVGTLVVFVGLFCFSGTTQIAISGMAADSGDIAVGIFTGVGTVGLHTAGSTATASTLTSASMSYQGNFSAAPQPWIFGATAQNGTTTWSASTWSNGNTNHNIWNSHAQKGITLDYNIGDNVHSTTTYTANLGASEPLSQLNVILNPVCIGSNTGGSGAVILKVPVGTFVVVVFGLSVVGAGTYTCSDSGPGGNTYNADCQQVGTNGSQVAIFSTYTTNLFTGVTGGLSGGSGGWANYIVLAFDGAFIKSTSQLDKTAVNSTMASVSSLSTGSTGTLSQPNELCITGTVSFALNTWTPTPASYIKITDNNGVNTAAAWEMVNNTAAQNVTWTRDVNTRQQGVAIATYKQAASGLAQGNMLAVMGL